MKKSLILFLCGALFSVLSLEAIVRSLSPLLGPPLTKWNTMEDAKILKLKELSNKYPRPSYVFMGNSTTLIGLNPKVFTSEIDLPDGASFNAAMNGSEIRQIRDFACGFILEAVMPKNLVILFSNSAMAKSVDYQPMKFSSSNLEKYSYLYRYRNTFRDPLTLNTFLRILKYQDKRQGLVYRWADNLDDFGYSKYGTTDADITPLGWNPIEFREDIVSKQKSIHPKDLKYLTEIRDFALAQGIKLIIGTVPTISYEPLYRREIEDMANYLGVEFVQGNDAIGQGKYFQDGVHLNRQGSIEFSKYLARELAFLAKH
jgi:hypothetical protein